MRSIEFIHEPTDLQCGQAVLAMITKKNIAEIIGFLGNERETTLAEMKKTLEHYGVAFSHERKQAFVKEDLPPFCILSLETPRCWHWSLYCEGRFYDPEHGVLDDFPTAERKYYWEIFFCSEAESE